MNNSPGPHPDADGSETDTDTDLGRDLTEHLRGRAEAARPSADPGPSIMAFAGRRRARRRRSVSTLVSVVVVVAVIGGVAMSRARFDSTDVVTTSEGATGPAPFRLYRATGSLLQSTTEPLRLCLAGGLESSDLRPSDTAGVPRCGTNVLLPGVDLTAIPGVETKTWEGQTFTTSTVTVVGTWDGTSLTPTEPVRPGVEEPSPVRPTPDFSVPCPEPANGWPPMPPDVNAYTTALGQLDAYGESHPDFAGQWVGPDQETRVLAFTGDLATHQAELAAIYPRVCVIRGSRTMSSLKQIQQQLAAEGLPDGNRVMWSGIGLDEDRAAGPMVVTIGVLIDDPDVRAWLHDRYGDAVHIDAAPIHPA
jgi:hypothetical protein